MSTADWRKAWLDALDPESRALTELRVSIGNVIRDVVNERTEAVTYGDLRTGDIFVARDGTPLRVEGRKRLDVRFPQQDLVLTLSKAEDLSGREFEFRVGSLCEARKLNIPRE